MNCLIKHGNTNVRFDQRAVGSKQRLPTNIFDKFGDLETWVLSNEVGEERFQVFVVAPVGEDLDELGVGGEAERKARFLGAVEEGGGEIGLVSERVEDLGCCGSVFVGVIFGFGRF